MKRQGRTGVLLEQEPLGGVFEPVPGKRMKPAYSYGNPAAKTRPVMFTCPVSAIPEEVWQLLALWNACRLTRTLPRGGGLLDQPVWVQRYFPVLDASHREAEGSQGNTAEAAAMMAVGTMMKAMTGGGK